MRKTLKIIAWTIVAVVAVGMLLALVAGFFAPGIIRDFVVQKTGFGLSYDKFVVSPFSASIRIKNLKLTNPSSFNERAFIELPSARVALDLASLWSAKIHFHVIEVQLDSLTLVKRADGVTNAGLFGQAFQSPNQASKPTNSVEASAAPEKDIAIDRLSLKVGKFVSVDETRTPAKTHVSTLNLTVNQKNIASRAELQADLTAAALPALLENAGIKVAPLTKATGSTLGVAQKGVSLTTESVDAVAEKAANRLKNLIRKHE